MDVKERASYDLVPPEEKVREEGDLGVRKGSAPSQKWRLLQRIVQVLPWSTKDSQGAKDPQGSRRSSIGVLGARQSARIAPEQPPKKHGVCDVDSRVFFPPPLPHTTTTTTAAVVKQCHAESSPWVFF